MKPDAAALARSAELVENWMKDFLYDPTPVIRTAQTIPHRAESR